MVVGTRFSRFALLVAAVSTLGVVGIRLKGTLGITFRDPAATVSSEEKRLKKLTDLEEETRARFRHRERSWPSKSW